MAAKIHRISVSAGRSLLATAALVMLGTAQADIRLPRLVGDNMVLQRDAPLRLWGWADPGERVQIRFRHQTVAATAAADGQWSLTLAPLKAGGPDAMQLHGKHSLTLHNILVGDVWLASGQSNMEFPLLAQGNFGGVLHAEQEDSSANYPRMRLFVIKRDIAFKPKDDVESTGWQPVTPASAAAFSAVAYLFGRELHQRYRVPIGLIESSWGGTPAECWVSAPGLKPLSEFSAPVERESRVDAAQLGQYQVYLSQRNRWYEMHGREDHGRVNGQDLWAAENLDDADWSTTEEPQPWPLKASKSFDGTLWLRKRLQIPPQLAGSALRLHLPHLLQADATYFNGTWVGATSGENMQRDYAVPPQSVHGGSNVITVRLTGEYASGDGYVGMLGEASDLYAQLGAARYPLAGSWSFRAGPDLSALPDPPPLAEFMTRYPQAPALLFNAMIAPAVRYRIKGVIWYQGEANANRAAQYRTLFPRLIGDWRALWGYTMPFLFVQLAGYGPEQAEPADYAWAQLREAQTSALTLPATAMAVAIDIGDASDIHPKDKQDVAHRLVLGAERVAYAESIVGSGPTYRSMRLEGNRIRVQFSNTGSGLTIKRSDDGAAATVRGFAVAGNDGRFFWAQAQLDGAEVLLSSDAVASPAAVRYDWGNTPSGNLYNREGLPAVPFRTDAPPNRPVQ